MGYRMLDSVAAHWRPSNLMGVMTTDLAEQLEISEFGARLWRVAPGQANTRHRHRREVELYVLLEGHGRIRIDDEICDLRPGSSVAVDADSVRQVFNDTSADQLWLVVGAPNDPTPTAEDLAHLYPDGLKALPPELP